MIRLTISGMESIQSKLKQLGEPDLYKDVMHDTGDVAWKWLQLLCPVDKGALKASTYLTKTQNGFEIGATAKHAVYNEYGSISTPIGDINNPLSAKYAGFRPFLRVSAHRALSELNSIFKMRVEKIWK